MSNDNSWIESAKTLYKWNFIAWAFATALLLIKPIIDLNTGGFGVPLPFPPLLWMFLASPGVFIFFSLSQKLSTSDPKKSAEVFDRIWRVQNPLGIIGLVGAIVGGLPFFANFSGLVSNLGQLWYNLDLILPWISLYGFVLTYLIAREINRKRKATTS